jgi:hypothetical protein
MRPILALAVISLVAAEKWEQPRTLAEVRISQLTESSGLAASVRYPGVFWTHNDSGGGAWLFAFDREGKSRGRWRVPGVRARDWEALAIGPGPQSKTSYLYIGDIGDNDARRIRGVIVYRVPEPSITDVNGGEGETAAPEGLILTYPDGPHDAEALMVHPRTGDLYVVTKARGHDTDTLVFKAPAPLKAGSRTMLQRIAKIDLPGSSLITLLVGRITGGDISPDGRRVALCDYFRAWEAVLPAGSSDFDQIWKGNWTELSPGARQQGEAIAYTYDGSALIFTSEGKSFPLIELRRAPGAPKTRR